ncbi:MAG: hypothetical protein GY910_25845 [bacterium]|nr:hypothetical protein [bacterium]
MISMNRGGCRGGRCQPLACMTAAISVFLGLIGAWAGTARSELQRVEAVGIYGIRDSMRTRVIPRDEAIARARWEGVSRVALELIGESAPELLEDEFAEVLERLENEALLPDLGDELVPPLESTDAPPIGDPASLAPLPGDARLDREAPTEDEVAILESALGKDMLPYMRSYRILEDQGELPVLFADAPGIETEYVIVVEVVVDVARVSSALERAGLVTALDPETPDEALILEVVGLARYEALEAVLAALRGQLGATRVQTLVFERERQILAVEGPFGEESLSSWLARYRNPQLILEPLGVDPRSGRIRVMGRWFSESAESGPDAEPPS